MEKVIYFDMDGTIANLYAVEGWEQQLRNHNPSPYANAKVMLNMSYFARLLNKLQKQGYYIGIISWLAKKSNEDYDSEVKNVKIAWLKKHLHSVAFNEINIVPYGTPKHEIAKQKGGILFDDELKNRNQWNGIAYDEKNILEILKKLTKNA